MEETLKITKNHHKHLNNPFPSTPRSLPLVQGTLAFNPQTVPSDQIFSIGKEFLSTWRSKNGGSLSISHQSEPNRAIWSTIPGQAFVSAALAETEVEESRGSFVIRDRDVDFVCNHQIIEEIKVINQSDYETDSKAHDFPSGFEGKHQKTETQQTQFPVLLITGRIFGVNARKKKIQSFGMYSDFVENEPSISAKYWVFFDQKTSNQIGFHVKIGKPNSHFHRTISSRIYGHRIGWRRYFPKRKAIVTASTNEEDVLVNGDGHKDFNRVCLTYSSDRNERFFGFGEQFSHMDFKGKRVPILVQEQGIGRGDQPITFAANLVSYR